MVIIKNLKTIREKKGYSQLKVAMHTDLTQNLISYYENGQYEPSLNTLIKLAKYLNTSVDYLLELTTDDSPTNQRIKSNLSKKENEVLELYAKLAFEDQERMIIILEAFANENEKQKNLTVTS